MRKCLRMVSVLMVLVITMTVPVYAQENNARSNAYISAYDSALFRGTGAEFHIWFQVIGNQRMDEIGASEIRVQQSPTGTGDWTTVKIFRKADYPQMICENTVAHTSHLTYYGLSGNYYRAIVLVYAAKGNGSGCMIDYAEVLYLSPQY